MHIEIRVDLTACRLTSLDISSNLILLDRIVQLAVLALKDLYHAIQASLETLHQVFGLHRLGTFVRIADLVFEHLEAKIS